MPFHSIGIIGGADGPTVIFVNSSPSGKVLVIVGILLAAMVTGIVLFTQKKRRKHK